MQCSEEEALVRFFYNVSSSFLLLLLFLRFSSALLSDVLYFVSSFSLFRRNQQDYEYEYSDEEDVEEEEVEEEEPQLGHSYFQVSSMEEADLVADVIHGGEALSLHAGGSPYEFHKAPHEESGNCWEAPAGETDDSQSSEQFSARDSLGREREENTEEEIPARDSDSVHNSVGSTDDGPPSPVMLDRYRTDITNNDIPVYDEISESKEEMNNLRGNGRLITSAVPEVEAKNFQGRPDNDFEEIFGDSCTAGSTSKSSSEWRSSTINCRDSGTEDPFSSSSRRSCPKWESYTLFQKYDEEMMFLDRISAQKLEETESLRSIKVRPRSISERIVHKIATGNKRQPSDFRNPYHELEAAYVAEICLTWEALNWNYKNIRSKHSSKARDIDPGCPARIAQQFQQFQVLLQRYVENEPYEQGRRPEVFARMRLLATKLLQVPEYRDSEDDADQKEEGFGSRISSAAFLMIMEDGIRTFMNFLKADKVKVSQVIASFFSRNRRGPVDPTLLTLMKKVNKKKKMKLKELRRAGRCIRKRKLNVDEEMEILMGLIDLKVVSRVLRMGDLSEEQLHWCEAKMSKVRLAYGRLQRDSSPLFFPAH
ncbi:uncharacterized protein LOC116215525 [Punica granatum]|uniref:Ribosomal protein L34Ae n=2 Tax=Punica granatum TaxID=22663 RepID=A0A218VXY1_PUNGR|nr:uncharacterized protein LOC116215525 [Punica granatum]OWM65139.1 hypothetical protein CDL15_Pgr008726 [Punica granatum]PKI43859.1 hypothetical protein CRG98_035693 [Punica granatum]